MEVYGRRPINLGQTTIPRGQVYLIPDRCKECDICIQFCPKQVLRKSKLANSKGYHYPEVVPGKGTECVHCQFCSLVCPEFAIFTHEVAR